MVPATGKSDPLLPAFPLPKRAALPDDVAAAVARHIVARYMAGATVQALAVDTGRSPNTIYRMLAGTGTPLRPAAPRVGTKMAPRLTGRARQVFIRKQAARYTAGMSFRQLAADTGYSATAIRGLLDGAVEVRPRGPHRTPEPA